MVAALQEKCPQSSLHYPTQAEFTAQSAASFDRDEVGLKTASADPLPPSPILYNGGWGEDNMEKVSLSPG